MTEDFTPGEARPLAPGLTRIVAPNPGPMTGPGTNTYLVGEEELAVVDPGPDDPSHVEAICAAGAGRIGWILVTHTHRDHSPAARRLREQTGATIVGLWPPDDGRQDRRFRPDAVPADGERVLLMGTAIRCIATPGHASNHLCFLHEETGVLFTGDHVLGHVSPVILPPDGDMADYLDSLARLREMPLTCIAPGHGPLLERPCEVIDALVAHRLAREEKVASWLGRLEAATLDDLLEAVYDDVESSRHAIAAHSLLAHLLKLERDGRAACDGDRWSPAG